MNLPIKIVKALDSLSIKVNPYWDNNTLLKDIVEDSLEYYELLAELDLNYENNYLTLGDLINDNL